MDDLLKMTEDAAIAAHAPLAVRMRPRSMDEILGQEAFCGEGKLLRRMLEAQALSSLVFHGPPGCGKTTLAQLLDILNHAALVVSNDTGPAHLSIALGTPSVVIVGGGHFGCFVPYPDQACPDTARFVYEKMDCYHCFWNCPKRATNTDSFPCVEAVSMDAVWDAAEQLLDARP